MKKKLKAYDKYQVDSSKKASGIYKFPGEFFVLGVIAIMIDMMIEHPVVTPELTILGIILFFMEAYFLFKRYVSDKDEKENLK